MAKANINKLTEALRHLLLTKNLHTQAELEEALQHLGFAANQSKISRALRKLGAIKIKTIHGTMAYQLPKEPSPPSPTDLSDLVTGIEHNEILIVLHTIPGSAALIARLLDHQREQLNIMGTVAGDDTIIIIPKSVKQTEKTVSTIKLFLGLNE